MRDVRPGDISDAVIRKEDGDEPAEKASGGKVGMVNDWRRT